MPKQSEIPADERTGKHLFQNRIEELEVEASTESRMTESSDSGGRAISSSFFRDYSAVRVNQTLGAVEMLGMVKVDERDAAGFVLSQGAASRMQQLSEQAVESLKAKGAGKPMEVIGVGFAPIVGGDTGKAKEQAMLQAQRFAVEAAMGASVVGLAVKDSGQDSETFRETCVSNSDGSIATFTVLEEGPADGNYRVKIRAVVQQGKLLDSYRAHLRTMGDPMFCVDAGGNDTLRQMAVDFFKEKGLPLPNHCQACCAIRKQLREKEARGGGGKANRR
jgi:hypothetical protein